ncbi:MAG TPA: serine hydrolase, partial [Thermomicrobiales bacterium]|nr:serine hydrolase [Thermomicrobiales bacterium]
PALLAEADRRAQVELPRLSALAVVRGGDLVFERYYGGQQPEQPIDLWSATKSVTNMAVGMAVADGKLRLDQTLGELIPERIPANADPLTRRVSVENLLTMTAGWQWDSRTDFLHLDDAPDWAARTLALPMACYPGVCYEYNSGGVHLLSVILQKVTGETEAAYLQPRLFDPLGIARPTWRQSPQGETAGAFGLELTARDAAKLGFLYLNGGVWAGKQIVPASWVATSTVEHSSGTSPSGVNLGQTGYGYLWWTTATAGHPAYFALGYGSQLIYVVPALDLVVVALVAAPRQDQQQDPIPLVEGAIVPAALAGPPAVVSAATPAGQPSAATPVSLTASAATPAPTEVAGGRLLTLPGERLFPFGIAAQPATDDFFVGSAIDGAILRGNVATGAVQTFSAGRAGLVALGLALDDRGRLFVAGGETGVVAVYDVATGARLTEFGNGLAPNTYLSGVAVARDGDAYVTDAFNPLLYRVPAAALPTRGATPVAAATPAAPGALDVFLDLSATPFDFAQPGFNATSIVATPDGRFLLLAQSNAGALYRVDLASRAIERIDLGGSVLTGAAGMTLNGQRLFVIVGNEIAAVDLASDFASGRIVDRIASPTFASPSSLARDDGCLLVVNSQFDRLESGPVLPFTVASVPIGGAAAAPGTPPAATPHAAFC